MNMFTPSVLTSTGSHKNENIYSFSGKTKSLSESYFEAETAVNGLKRSIKYDMYKAIMNTNNPYIIETAMNHAKKLEDEVNKTTNLFAESFMELKKSDNYSLMDQVHEHNYMLNEEIEQIKFLSYMKECMILSNPNGHFSQLVNLREATGSRIKETIDKAIAAIRRIFDKFLEKLRSIGKDRKKYLEKYKQTILSQKPKAQKVKVYNYEEAFNRYKTTIPMISFIDLKNTCNGITDDKEIQDAIFKKFPNISNGYDPSKTTIAEHCKQYYQIGDNAEKIEVEMQQVNMTDIYNFLYDENKITTNIDNDLKRFKSHMDRLSKEAQAEAEKAQSEEEKKNESAVVYSAVNESYIMEFEVTEDNTANDQATGSGNQPQSTRLSDNIQNVPQTDDKEKPDTANFDGQYTTNYVAVVQTVLAAKMTSVETIGKDLFLLVRNHVKNFINNETYVSTQKSGTNYSQDNQQPEQNK